MFDNGNLVFVTQSVPSNSDYDDEQYNSLTSDEANVTNSGNKLVFDENGMMYVLKRNSQRPYLTPRSIPSTSGNYHRVPLQLLRLSSHSLLSFQGVQIAVAGIFCGLNLIIYVSILTETKELGLVDTIMYVVLVQTTGKCVVHTHRQLCVGECSFVGVLCWGSFNIYKNKSKTLRPTSHAVDSICHSFTYRELVEATADFKEELGRGAFGIVYEGVMPIRSRNVVATKKLDRVVQEAEKKKEFMAEVNVISLTHHKNLVRLLGYFDEGSHRLLVYEYMRNSTLANFIFGDPKPTWSQRTKVAMGIARGLAYLHEE